MRGMREFCLIAVAAVCSTICFAGGLTDLRKNFPEEKFIAAVGEGMTKDAARKSALAELAAYFSQTVAGGVTAKSVMQNGNGVFSAQERIERIVETSSSASLFSVRYTGFSYDRRGKSYSVCAYISRDEAWLVLSRRLDLLQGAFTASVAAAERERDPLRRLFLLGSAVDDMADFEGLYFMALAVFPGRGGEYGRTLERKAVLEKEVRSAKSGMKIRVLASGDFAADTRSRLEGILSGAGFSVVRGAAQYDFSAVTNVMRQSHGEILYAQAEVTLTLGGATLCAMTDRLSAYNEQTLERLCRAEAVRILESLAQEHLR